MTNIKLLDPLNDPLPQQPTFDLVTTFDVVHDTPYPDRLISDIYRALKPQSYWFCEDIKGSKPLTRIYKPPHCWAVVWLFGHGVYELWFVDRRWGRTRTLGFTRNLAEQMTLAAGFDEFSQLDIDSPMNNYYLLKKA